jgi:hypothetical protein
MEFERSRKANNCSNMHEREEDEIGFDVLGIESGPQNAFHILFIIYRLNYWD